MQSTSKILMIRPINFGFNEQTAGNNSFQVRGFEENSNDLAQKEFDQFVSILKENLVDVITIQDSSEPVTPDSIFPNNWFSTHEGKTMVLYPMYAPNRREERKESVIEKIKEICNIKRVVDLTYLENDSKFLEGTGSMILDRDNNLLYACKSPRTDVSALEEFCDQLDYDMFVFEAYDRDSKEIYHTNVMMSVCSDFVTICLDSIKDLNQRESIIELIEESGKEILEISLDQMENFAGNMLEIRSTKGEKIIVMSKRAYESLDSDQIETIAHYAKIIYSNLETIENNGGGSARCMIAELF